MTLKKFILDFWITIRTIVQIGHKRFKESKEAGNYETLTFLQAKRGKA